jgi:hypothetical protein
MKGIEDFAEIFLTIRSSFIKNTNLQLSLILAELLSESENGEFDSIDLGEVIDSTEIGFDHYDI